MKSPFSLKLTVRKLSKFSLTSSSTASTTAKEGGETKVRFYDMEDNNSS